MTGTLSRGCVGAGRYACNGDSWQGGRPCQGGGRRVQTGEEAITAERSAQSYFGLDVGAALGGHAWKSLRIDLRMA